MSDKLENHCWAITSFFNPAAFGRRIRNYRVFRSNLSIPLVAVEMSVGDRFELTDADADILIRVDGGACLWQKERLLNVALQHLPRCARYIAWLDCDIIFEDTNWCSKLPDALERSPVVQCFSELVELPPDGKEHSFGGPRSSVTKYSISHLAKAGMSQQSDFTPSSAKGERRAQFGFAWAARREFILRHGFYDAMIIGSGDRAMACAAFGRLNDAIISARMTENRSEHYLEWARPFYEDIAGPVGVLEGKIAHLWHGAIANRKYRQRHEKLALVDFDPVRDLNVGASGAWEWSTAASFELRQLLRDYFSLRLEDG